MFVCSIVSFHHSFSGMSKGVECTVYILSSCYDSWGVIFGHDWKCVGPSSCFFTAVSFFLTSVDLVCVCVQFLTEAEFLLSEG